MKSYLLLLLMLLSGHTISAQLIITSGAQFSIAGNMDLVLQNINLINNGNFATGAATISFTGNVASSVSGSQPVQFAAIELKKDNNAVVLLQRDINVSQRIVFTSGFLNLNGFNTSLGTTGQLEGEKESSRVVGNAGGEVVIAVTVNVNSPTAFNPGNVGAIITSDQNLGVLVIRRGHRPQSVNSGPANSISRYFDIVPENNANLNATLRFNYFDAELNGLDENTLNVFETQNNVTWTNLGSFSRNTIANFVEKTGISSFGKITLSAATAIGLPVKFILFNAKCEGNKVNITWKTAQEINSHHFNIERSSDGINWIIIGNVNAAGNSGFERSYSFTDINPTQNNFYRIAENDLDGKVQYTSILRSSCNATDAFSLWPNPVQDQLSINIITGNSSPAIIKIVDSKGALVKTEKVNLLQGSNQFIVDMTSLARGIYSVSAFWNNGQMKKTVQVIKQ